MVTEGTWATQGTAASYTDTAGSDCTDDTCGSIWEEVETVFNMTGAGVCVCVWVVLQKWTHILQAQGPLRAGRKGGGATREGGAWAGQVTLLIVLVGKYRHGTMYRQLPVLL
jgi:hypothetical protein